MTMEQIHEITFGSEKPDPRPVNIDFGLEFYMRRGNRFYFRSDFCKKVLELSPVPPELTQMKYGTKVCMEWS